MVYLGHKFLFYAMRNPPLILVVDDEESFREIMSIKLKASGFEVATVASGEEALIAAEKILPDLILMDIHMGGMPGTEAAMALKQNLKTKDLKIAFLSSLNDPWPAMSGEKNDVSKELGMEAFLDKGMDLDELIKKVRNILSISGAVVPAPPPEPHD